MNNLAELSVRAYAVLMPLYPADLRREFQSDMIELFAEDLSNALRYSGCKGAMRVWRCALKEFVRIALPAHAQNRIIAVPCILFCLNELILILELAVAFGWHLAPVEFMIAGLWPSLIAALTSIPVVVLGRRSPFCLLGLGPGSCSKFTI
jgi:hypothetical protein